ncbi:NlpC/P60 family protein, partial [Staphylococcus aureus]
YSWAAGNASGPTYGVSEPGNAWNDSNVLGFDCSGLTLYAWAPYLRMDHYAATQYTQAGSYHPSTDNLMPGDLVFWSGDGTIGGIGHE